MLIEKFNKSIFSQLFLYGDINVIEWARNVYRKIKQNGILPIFIDRGKEDNDSNINISNSTLQSLLSDNILFTFGKCIASQNLPLEKEVNLGTSHTIEFEISNVDFTWFKFLNDGANSLSCVRVGLTYISYVCNGERLPFTGFTISEITKVKIVRNNLNVSLYVDGVNCGDSMLTNNNEYVFNMLVERQPEVGDLYKGGVVTYSHELYGLIADINDLSVEKWNDGDYTNITTGDAIGSGRDNSILINDFYFDSNSAAKECLDAVKGGYSDWFLPSKNELIESMKGVPSIFYNGGDPGLGQYWSSSEYAWDKAICVNSMSSPIADSFRLDKHFICSVKMIRYF